MMIARKISVRMTISDPVRFRYSDISRREKLASVAAGAERLAATARSVPNDEAQKRADAARRGAPAPVALVPAASNDRHQK